MLAIVGVGTQNTIILILFLIDWTPKCYSLDFICDDCEKIFNPATHLKKHTVNRQGGCPATLVRGHFRIVFSTKYLLTYGAKSCFANIHLFWKPLPACLHFKMGPKRYWYFSIVVLYWFLKVHQLYKMLWFKLSFGEAFSQPLWWEPFLGSPSVKTLLEMCKCIL